MEKSARRMASTTSDTGDNSSEQQQAQRKQKYNKRKRPVSSVDHCHPVIQEKKEKQLLILHMCVYACMPTHVSLCVELSSCVDRCSKIVKRQIH